jgi:assimilatory nitrate reductase catalytic subunit
MSVAPVATHCPHCALQCGVHVTAGADGLGLSGNDAYPVNNGSLCTRGRAATATFGRPDRLRTPLVRTAAGILEPASWDEALNLVAQRFGELQTRFGPDSIGVFGSGALTNEKAYLLAKFARVALGTANIDSNARFCMSSAAAASTMAFGLDRGLPFPLQDIPQATAILLAGANIAETMPPLMQYFDDQQARGGSLVVVDPRRTATADRATRHLAIRPGTDAALANGILHVLVRDDLIDAAYIRERTDGFEAVRRIAEIYWPGRVEEITGVSEADIIETARRLAAAPHPMILTARGPEQQSEGVNNTLAYINIALALGAVGRPFSGYGCLTGQGNGQGGREHGQRADQLPGYRSIDDEAARIQVADIWGVPASAIPGAGKSAVELLNSIGRPRGLRSLFVMGANLVVSAPNAQLVREKMQSLDLLVVSDFFLSETAEIAHVVLPSAQWAEEEGTLTNLEGRVVMRRRVLEPPADVRTDIDILCELARRLGHRRQFTYANAEDVFNELRRATRGSPADYSGISYARITSTDGVFWPCPSLDHPGTPRLFADTFPTENGRAHFHAVSHRSIADEPTDAYPLLLTTGRMLADEPCVEIHPATATLYGLCAGACATLRTRRGAAVFRVKITDAIREDTLFVPFHWGSGHSVNVLTNAALDPTSKMPELKVCAARIEPI